MTRFTEILTRFTEILTVLLSSGPVLLNYGTRVLPVYLIDLGTLMCLVS